MSGGEASASQLLARLDATGDLSVLRIRDSIFENSSESPNKRESDALTVTDGFDNATPASLLEDLAHYKARVLMCHQHPATRIHSNTRFRLHLLMQ